MSTKDVRKTKTPQITTEIQAGAGQCSTRNEKITDTGFYKLPEILIPLFVLWIPREIADYSSLLFFCWMEISFSLSILISIYNLQLTIYNL